MKWIALSLWVALLTGPMTLMAGEKEMTDHQKQAEQLYHEGRFPEARKQFLLALEQTPDNSQTLHKLALLALWDNDTDQAFNYLNRAYEHSGWL